jgi:hypothetical protein
MAWGSAKWKAGTEESGRGVATGTVKFATPGVEEEVPHINANDWFYVAEEPTWRELIQIRTVDQCTRRISAMKGITMYNVSYSHSEAQKCTMSASALGTLDIHAVANHSASMTHHFKVEFYSSDDFTKRNKHRR